MATVGLIGDTYMHLVAWCLVKSRVQSNVSGGISYHVPLHLGNLFVIKKQLKLLYPNRRGRTIG